MRKLSFLSLIASSFVVMVPAVSLAHVGVNLAPHHGQSPQTSNPGMVHCDMPYRGDTRPIETRLNADLIDKAVPCHSHLEHDPTGAYTIHNDAADEAEAVKSAQESDLADRKSNL